MMNRIFTALQNENGSTLVEVVIAMVVMTIVLIGGLQFVSVGREYLAVEKYYRVALMITESRLEKARKFSYESLSDSLSESNTAVAMENITGTRSTVVTDIDDAYDGTGAGDADGNTSDYKEIKVTVNWASRYAVSLKTYQSKYFYEVSY